MLGLNETTEREIATLPKVKHSWIAQLMTTMDPVQAEEEKDQIVVEKARKMGLNYPVQRLVRTALPLFLEREAISQYIQQNPQFLRALPMVHSPREAVEVAALDQMGVTEKDKEQAVELIRALQTHGKTSPQP